VVDDRDFGECAGCTLAAEQLVGKEGEEAWHVDTCAQLWTAKTAHVPGTPFNSRSPRSEN
jgi:hypothetical protein